MLLLLATPSDNDRSPRYMDKALAAIHQSGLDREPTTLIYGEVAGPIEANYPQCSVAEVAES